MEEHYQVGFFKYADGTNPVQQFFLQLTPKKRALILSGINLLEQIGLEILQMNCGNDINDHLWEVKKSAIRVIFMRHDNLFILLQGFEKFQKTTPRADLNIAEDRYDEYMRRIQK